MTAIIPYNREAAANYATRWAFDRNPRYLDFENMGGDCTNFTSQCIYAGAGVMNYRPVLGWYYNSAADRAPAWTGVEYLYNFLVSNQGNGPFAVETDIHHMEIGDFVQLGNLGGHFYHSPFICNIIGSPSLDNILVAAHTEDCCNRPLSTYTIAQIRFIHIEGVRK